MSAATFPSNLAGQIFETWSSGYKTRVLESVSGKEVRASWRSSGRRRFRVIFDCLREDVHCPTPNGSYHEVELVQAFLATHKGGWDSFAIADPISDASVQVRLDSDSITFQRIASGIWASEFDVVEVL